MAVASKATNPVKTVLVITIGFGILFLLTKHNWMLYVALSVGGLGVISTFLAEKIDWIWTKIGWILSKIVPNIIMTIVFYVVLTPTAFLSRLFGKKDPMDLRNSNESLWKSKGTTFSKESFDKPW
jgi:Saxitoxin biosynthesis operon protein SxtJ